MAPTSGRRSKASPRTPTSAASSCEAGAAGRRDAAFRLGGTPARNEGIALPFPVHAARSRRPEGQGARDPPPSVRRVRLPDPVLSQARPVERARFLAPVAPYPQRRLGPRLQGATRTLSELGGRPRRADRGRAGGHR